MASDSVSVRRATIEDLGGLRGLWARQNASVADLDLDKHFTDFQVAIDESGTIRSAIGLRILCGDGCIYGESIPGNDADSSDDSMRKALWARVQNVARNHGLIRLWTCLEVAGEGDATFQSVQPDIAAKRPPEFDKLGSGRWFVAILREESAAALSMEQELQLFQEAQKESTAKVLEHARSLRWIAYGLLCLALAVGIIAVISTIGSRNATP